jgi:hypothetical protein
MSPVIALRGSVGEQRLRADLIAGLASPASAHLEAVAVGRAFFTFVAQQDDATLLLQQDKRVLEHGRSADVLEALAGVPLDPAALRMVLTGCPTLAVNSAAGGQLQDNWRVVTDADGLVYLHRTQRNAPWRLVTATHTGTSVPWRAEYRDFVNNLPQSIRLKSDDGKRFDLKLTLKELDINVPIDPEAFRLQIPPGVTPITLDELRRSGPLSVSPSSNDNGR